MKIKTYEVTIRVPKFVVKKRFFGLIQEVEETYEYKKKKIASKKTVSGLDKILKAGELASLLTITGISIVSFEEV
tara:strand:- start:96 stop:320 length:225 start_codon:yes stop_codon:yes gene_type:complete